MSLSTDHFDQLADDWWDSNGPMRSLHHINPARCAFIKQFFNFSHQARLLDLGCGAGLLTESLQTMYPTYSITGIDTSQACIDIAKQHTPNPAIQYLHQSSHQHLEAMSAEYDGITCLELLEHLNNPEACIQDIDQLLKPGGICVFSTLDRNIYSFLFGICFAEYVAGIVPKGTHKHEWFIRPSELDRVMRSYHYQRLSLKGIHYMPLSQSAKLVDRISINYIAAYQKPIG